MESEEYSYALHIQGAGHYVSGETPAYDAVEELHKIVKEVTGYNPAPPPRRIGFY